MTTPIDPQRLRDLAETLDTCKWTHPIGSAQLCRDAADEIERLRSEYNALFNERQELRGVLGHGEQQPPVLSLAELATARISELEGALRPFAEAYNARSDEARYVLIHTGLGLDDWRAAAAAMGGAK